MVEHNLRWLPFLMYVRTLRTRNSLRNCLVYFHNWFYRTPILFIKCMFYGGNIVIGPRNDTGSGEPQNFHPYCHIGDLSWFWLFCFRPFGFIALKHCLVSQSFDFERTWCARNLISTCFLLTSVHIVIYCL